MKSVYQCLPEGNLQFPIFPRTCPKTPTFLPFFPRFGIGSLDSDSETWLNHSGALHSSFGIQYTDARLRPAVAMLTDGLWCGITMESLWNHYGWSGCVMGLSWFVPCAATTLQCLKISWKHQVTWGVWIWKGRPMSCECEFRAKKWNTTSLPLSISANVAWSARLIRHSGG